jgi:putative ABC transport system permease protein
MFYVNNELKYDKFNERSSRIFRLTTRFYIQDRIMDLATTSYLQGEMVKNEFPEVEDYVRFSRYGTSRIIKYGEKTFTEEKFLWADNSLFSIFSFKLKKGDPKLSLTQPYSVVITEKIAKKYFGDEDPLGKSLLVHNKDLYKVTGILENYPQTSHIRPDFIASFTSLNIYSTNDIANDLVGNVDYYTYLLLRKDSDPEQMERKLKDFKEKYIGALLQRLGCEADYNLQPLTKIYLHSQKENELEATSDIKYIYLFSAIGFFILLLSSLNFMNLSTARSSRRAKEIGLRKVIGAHRIQLVLRFLIESMLLTLISIFISILLIYITLSFFESISGKELSMNYFFDPYIALGLFGLFVVLGILSGSYSAFFLSSFRPVEVLQGKFSIRTSHSVMRIILVSVQFTVSIILIIGTLMVNKQQNFIRSVRLGYEKNNIIALKIRNSETKKKYDSIKRELLQNPDILVVSASMHLPLGTTMFSAHHPVGKPQDEQIMLYGQIVDHDFLNTYGLELLQGRNFSRDFPNDPKESIIINETAADKLGWQNNALGQEIEMILSLDERIRYKVIGVVKDYHFQSLHEKIHPIALYNASPFGERYDKISARIAPGKINEVMGFIESKWKEFDPVYPLEYIFIDDQYDSLYRSEERLGQLFLYFTLLAIFVGCLGLFGLSSYSAEQKTKEIGIRKVLGASGFGIILLMLKEFMKWILLAVLIAWPLGYIVMNSWLENFAYRIKPSLDIFLLSSLLALLIAFATIIFQSVRASLAEPIDTLRYE